MEITVKCKGTLVHPNLFRTILTTSMGISNEGKKQAEKLFLLSAGLPNIQAGVLLDLVQGKLTYEIDDEAETFTIKDKRAYDINSVKNMINTPTGEYWILDFERETGRVTFKDGESIKVVTSDQYLIDGQLP